MSSYKRLSVRNHLLKMSLNKEKSIEMNYRRDSFSDRVCDDLCQYHSSISCHSKTDSNTRMCVQTVPEDGIPISKFT